MPEPPKSRWSGLTSTRRQVLIIAGVIAVVVLVALGGYFLSAVGSGSSAGNAAAGSTLGPGSYTVAANRTITVITTAPGITQTVTGPTTTVTGPTTTVTVTNPTITAPTTTGITTTTTPTLTGALTGTHWAPPTAYATLAANGMGFAITNVAPGDLTTAKARLDAAHAAGIRLIIGLYSFGGPEPYTLNADGTWTFTQGSIDVINYLKSRSADVLAFFGMNEPYWTGPNGTNSCGYYSAANLRQFRTQLQGLWAGVKVYQDIGWPDEWAPGGALANAYACLGTKYADQTGVADYVGIWDYPFTMSGYNKVSALARLEKESAYVVSSMHATPVWLAQSFADSAGELYPTDAQIKDWNCTIRANIPAGGLISWYVWEQPGLYSDYLSLHPSQWPLTSAAAC